METANPACKKAKEESENADSYLTEAHQQCINNNTQEVGLLITGQFKATFKKPVKLLGQFHFEAGDGKDSSVDENENAVAGMLITGQFKVIIVVHNDTPEHYEDLTVRQLDNTLEELEPNSLEHFYIEAGPTAHS